jgi:hypothetical protein
MPPRSEIENTSVSPRGQDNSEIRMEQSRNSLAGQLSGRVWTDERAAVYIDVPFLESLFW